MDKKQGQVIFINYNKFPVDKKDFDELQKLPTRSKRF